MDLSPVIISARTASVSIVFTFFLGLAAAAWVLSLKGRWLRIIMDGIFTLPLVLPPTVAGFFLLYIFGLRGPVGRLFMNFFAVKIAFSWSATVLAAVFVSFPLMYRSSRGALEQLDPNLANAGRTLGMSEWRIFWKVSLPTALPGVAGGAVLAFARGLGEFGATAMIAGNIAGKTRTVPLAIYSAVSAGDMRLAGRYVLIIMLISLVVIALIDFVNCMDSFDSGQRVKR
jgi:molybdate transport system permease protein